MAKTTPFTQDQVDSLKNPSNKLKAEIELLNLENLVKYAEQYGDTLSDLDKAKIVREIKEATVRHKILVACS